jgi:ribosomal protein L40E
METKECPSCYADVPVVASRCKHCFHDFNEAPPKKSNNLIGLLVLLLSLVVIGAGTFYYVSNGMKSERILVDAETQSIVVTRTSGSGTTTERVEFSDIEKVEYVMGGDTETFEIVAVTSRGDRYIIQASGDKPLKGHAEHIAAVIDKPLVEVRNIKTFGD